MQKNLSLECSNKILIESNEAQRKALERMLNPSQLIKTKIVRIEFSSN